MRLTAEDGYQAAALLLDRLGAGARRALELTVERLDDGEVSPYLTEEVRAGDQLELRGPIGGHFTWSADDGGPLLLVGGGSGLVPLMAMLRHRAARGERRRRRTCSSRRARPRTRSTATSSRALDPAGLHLARTYTRAAPPGWTGWTRRVDAEMLAAVGPPPAARAARLRLRPDRVRRAASPTCWSTPATTPRRIHAERFGPTGG